MKASVGTGLVGLFNHHQVVDLAHHTHDLRSGYVHHTLIHFAQPQGLHCILLPLGPVNDAFNLSDLYLIELIHRASDLEGETAFLLLIIH